MLYKTSTYRTAPLLHCTMKYRVALHKNVGMILDSKIYDALHNGGWYLLHCTIGVKDAQFLQHYCISYSSTFDALHNDQMIWNHLCCTAQNDRSCAHIAHFALKSGIMRTYCVGGAGATGGHVDSVYGVIHRRGILKCKPVSWYIDLSTHEIL
jgi:hypothetical protein